MASITRAWADARKKHSDELRLMLVMMTGTVAFPDRDKRDQRGSTANDSSRIQSESKARLKSPQAEVERASSRVQMALFDSSIDPVTGLPARAQAEQAIAAKITAGHEQVAAQFIVDRLSSINSRFGRATGDGILMLVAQQLAKPFPALPYSVGAGRRFSPFSRSRRRRRRPRGAASHPLPVPGAENILASRGRRGVSEPRSVCGLGLVKQ